MKLTALQLDTLAQIFHHGVGQAAQALSELAGEEVLHATQNLGNPNLNLQINFKIASRHIQGYLALLLDVTPSDLSEKKTSAFLGSLQ